MGIYRIGGQMCTHRRDDATPERRATGRTVGVDLDVAVPPLEIEEPIDRL